MRYPIVYIAGPYRAETGWALERNIREAEELGFRVAHCGAVPLIPHTMYRFYDRTLDDAFWIDGTLALLAKSDAAVLTKRWTASVGARGEHAFAEANRIEVFGEAHVPDGLRRWVEDWKRRHAA